MKIMLVLLCAVQALAADLVLTDRATVMHDAVGHTRAVIRDTLMARWVNPRQVPPYGEMIYDTLYEIVEVYRRPAGPLRFAWNEITAAEWNEEVWLEDGVPRTQIFCMTGPKANQMTSTVDLLEAGRRMSPTDYWTIITSSIHIESGWGLYHRQAYSTGFFAWAFRTVIQDDFEYLVVHYQPAYSEYSISVRAPAHQECARSMWSPEVADAGFPLPQDSLPRLIAPEVVDAEWVYVLPAAAGTSPDELTCYLLSGTAVQLPQAAVVNSRSGTLLLRACELPLGVESVVRLSDRSSWLLGAIDIIGVPEVVR